MKEKAKFTPGEINKELLEACKQALALLSESSMKEDNFLTGQVFIDALKRLIARAEGEGD